MKVLKYLGIQPSDESIFMSQIKFWWNKQLCIGRVLENVEIYQKWQFRLENENFEISWNLAYLFWTIKWVSNLARRKFQIVACRHWMCFHAANFDISNFCIYCFIATCMFNLKNSLRYGFELLRTRMWKKSRKILKPRHGLRLGQNLNRGLPELKISVQCLNFRAYSKNTRMAWF